jgi:hypothetical protein
MAATSFGHLITSDIFPPTGGYKPVNGTIFDLLDKNNITWNDYFQDAPQATSFHTSPHLPPLPLFLARLQPEPSPRSPSSIPTSDSPARPLKTTSILPPTCHEVISIAKYWEADMNGSSAVYPVEEAVKAQKALRDNWLLRLTARLPNFAPSRIFS